MKKIKYIFDKCGVAGVVLKTDLSFITTVSLTSLSDLISYNLIQDQLCLKVSVMSANESSASVRLIQPTNGTGRKI